MLCPIALHHSIDGSGRCAWHVNVLVKVISFFAEIGRADWQVIVHRVIDTCDSAVISSFYHVDDAWMMHEIFAVLNSCGS